MPKTKLNLTKGKAAELIQAAERELSAQFDAAEKIELVNQRRILDAFRNHRVAEEHFAERTGYGIDDPGRQVIDSIFADVFETEAAAVRMQMVSGTHAIACALFGNLKAAERMVVLTGRPYDTLHQVIGAGERVEGSLVANGIDYVEFDLFARDQSLSKARERICQLAQSPTRLVHVQKSCGYSFDRPALSNQQIAEICSIVHQANPDCIVMIDNCYGEFVEDREPTALGADLVAGSLIKNPGGGLAISGGYIAGKKKLVDAALRRLTAPGIDGHLGVTFNQNRLLLEGLFLAPTVVLNALKSAMLIAQVLTQLGYLVKPAAGEPRADIIQAVQFGAPEPLAAFMKAVQKNSPVNSHVVPEPALMPGYEDKVIMAGGTFVENSTIEFSADAPWRPPFVAYIQGGISYLHVKCALEEALLGLLPG